MSRYDREAALRYAEQWALARNPRFLNFDRLGGDCTNYVSQCLYAGIKEMNYTPVYGWYYSSSYKRTPSWTGVAFLYEFLVNNKKAGPRAEEVARPLVSPGDIAQIGHADGRFFHSPFVVAVTPEEIYIAAHSHDCWMRPLSSYAYDRVRYLHVTGSGDA